MIRLKDLYEQGLVKFGKKNYEDACKLFKEALNIEFSGFNGQDMDFREKIKSKLKTSEQKHNIIYTNKINSLIEEGDKNKSPISVYESAFKLVNKLFVLTYPDIQFKKIKLSEIKKCPRCGLIRHKFEPNCFRCGLNFRRIINLVTNKIKSKNLEEELRLKNIKQELALERRGKLHQSEFNKPTRIENMIINKLDNAYRSEIQLLNENAKKLKESKNLNEAYKKLNLALELVKKISNSEVKNNSINETNGIFDQIYLIEINNLIKQADMKRRENDLNKTIAILNDALLKAINIKLEDKRKLKEQEINNHIDTVYLEIINEKMIRGNELKKNMNFKESLNNFEEALDFVNKIKNSNKKNDQTQRIKELINLTKIGKIKNTVIQLGTKFVRIKIKEIAEECREEDDIIESTVKEMIENNEIYAKYFESSKSIAFDQEIRIDEIDKLMKTYEDWEEGKFKKK